MNPLNEVSLDHLKQVAYEAYRNNSHSPEERAAAIVRDYAQELNDDLNSISAAARQDTPAEHLANILTRYQQKYEIHLSAWLYSQSRTASAFITGPSNFPVERMKKRRQWADNKYDYFREWRSRALKAIHKSLQPPRDELEEARQKLTERQKLQQLMVAANKIIRKGGPDLHQRLTKLGLTATDIQELLTPDWSNSMGFKGFQLTNNNAEIKRLKLRVAVLEEKKRLAETAGTTSEDLDGVKLVQNYEADRVQLLFDGKPPQDVIQELKSNGFNWSPTRQAWQRKLTQQAVHVARQIGSKGGRKR